MKRTVQVVAIAAFAMSLAGIAQAGVITGFSLDSEASPSGNPASYIVNGSVSYTSNSISFSTPSVGINNGAPDEAIFTIQTSGSIEGDNFVGCAAIAGTHDCINDNVFNSNFGSSGPNAVINDTIEWSDPVGLTGQTIAAEYTSLNAPNSGALVVQITGNELEVLDFCPSSCGVVGLDFTFTDVGPASPEPSTWLLLATGCVLTAWLKFGRHGEKACGEKA